MVSLFDDVPDGQSGDHWRADDGVTRRDRAMAQLRRWRSAIIRRLQRGFVAHLIDRGADTSDGVRPLVDIPPEIDPRCVGAAVLGLAEDGVIRCVGRRKSRRPEAHARKLDIWEVADPAAARLWLATHPDLPDPVAGEGVAGA